MKIAKTVLLFLILALVMLPSAMAQTRSGATEAHPAVPYPTKDTPAAIDRGELKAQGGQTPISVTVALSMRNLDQAEDLLKSLSTPGSAQYHQFLTSDQFVSRFGPTSAQVARVVAGLAKYGLSSTRVTATTLHVTGTPAAVESAFGVSLHSYDVPAHDNAPAYSYYAPISRGTIPSEIAGSVSAVAGLDSRPAFRPLTRTVLPSPRMAKQGVTPAGTGNPPGYLTVIDFANLYDVVPLYNHGITGKGRTLAIITLAAFTPSDAFAYWSALGLSVNPDRLTIVNVDGGPGAPSDASGSVETTLDVEQSGGIAPGANIIVYQAPNTNQAFIDAFAAAIDRNTPDSVSTSWGTWEWFDNLENAPVTDPATGRTVSSLQALHELLVRAGLQGQSFFAAAGDGGAYDITNDLGCLPPVCSITLSVDNPASDTAITAAGGTTLPVTLYFCENSTCTPPYFEVQVLNQRVWGWDYFDGLCAFFGLTPLECGFFPGGGGGGVSIEFLAPPYQWFLPGVQLSQPGQVYEAEPIIGELYDIGTYYALPAFFPGRNVPDMSFNADPYTGYLLYYTSSSTGFSIQPGWGGTSFVAPQLNGVTALLGQDTHSRLGLLNNTAYFLAQTGQAYWGSGAPFNVIAYGDNWFYYGRNGYSPAAGIGTMNVANFAKTLNGPF